MLTEEQKRKIELENERIASNMKNIKHRIVVFSGKGGVGKTTVSVNLAFGLQSLGLKTGILDADVTGPNVPKMLGFSSMPMSQGDRILPHLSHEVEVMSLAYLLKKDQPVIWRGPMRSKLINQFLSDVEWGQLDFLIADLPPGTGDEIITITQNMDPDLAIIVTTPQEVSLIDSARAIKMAKELKIPKIALIENMSTMKCPECGCNIDLFGSGGGRKQAQEMDILFLGSLPVDIDARKFADEGKPIFLANNKAEISLAILKITKKIHEMLHKKSSKKSEASNKRKTEKVI